MASLSHHNGRLDMSWTVAHAARASAPIGWNESEGPAPSEARRPGFDSRLINMVIERQLNGDAPDLRHQSHHAQLTVPLTHERWPTPVHSQIPATQAFMPPP